MIYSIKIEKLVLGKRFTLGQMKTSFFFGTRWKGLDIKSIYVPKSGSPRIENEPPTFEYDTKADKALQLYRDEIKDKKFSHKGYKITPVLFYGWATNTSVAYLIEKFHTNHRKDFVFAYKLEHAKNRIDDYQREQKEKISYTSIK
jgi:hypothetical protein